MDFVQIDVDFTKNKDMGNKLFTDRVVDKWKRFSIPVVSVDALDSFMGALDEFMDTEDRH